MSDGPPYDPTEEFSSESIEVVTPQFERVDGNEVPAAPEDFEALRTLSPDRLTDLGLQSWDGTLYLFPAEWYEHIPTGFEVTTINGETEQFDPDTSSADRRFGALAYGIEVDA
jgi:hypothetical protein